MVTGQWNVSGYMSKVQYRESKLLWLYNYLHLKSGFQFSLDQYWDLAPKKYFIFMRINLFVVALSFFCLPGIPFTSWWRLSYFIFFPKYFLKFWSLNLEFCCFIFLYFFVYFTDSNIWIFVLFVTSIGSWENTNSYSRHALISSVLFIPK